MHTCPLLRASMESRKIVERRISRTRATTSVRHWMAIRASLAGLTGWRALRDVLNAIPDSNDDFGLF
ncbi:hypothetical protein [Paraburkholderia aspalathi]|uniref:Uncharacterized protein n=1 Tax=Paraburkholderia aspalathi TaxID=1324617 RepID=A0A1I7ECA9_9BURK|nr:hypothetical protein [Paraburkholderia aspalathi]SFU21568.1 hypothetical protein SAMN05192563_1016121 [Paraburkholderia aspalathi]